MKYSLDKLKKVDLRDVWPHEALDFTKWLSEEPNLAMLSSAVGIELELIETESSVGSFNVDIYAQEAGTGRKVIIENQLEDTNHDHLGKVITYAAGKGAEVVIWVVARARDEHRQAIEWLNQHTDSDFGFFLVEVELWSIGDSLPAPRFSVVEQPNEWTKAIKLSEGLSETERVKLSYWTKYREVAQATPEFLKVFNPQKPSKNHWTTLRCDTSAYHIGLLIDTQRAVLASSSTCPTTRKSAARPSTTPSCLKSDSALQPRLLTPRRHRDFASTKTAVRSRITRPSGRDSYPSSSSGLSP